MSLLYDVDVLLHEAEEAEKTYIQSCEERFEGAIGESIRTQLVDAEIVLLLVHRAINDIIKYLDDNVDCRLSSAQFNHRSFRSFFVPEFIDGNVHADTKRMATLAASSFVEALLMFSNNCSNKASVELENDLKSIEKSISDHIQQFKDSTSMFGLVDVANSLMECVIKHISTTGHRDLAELTEIDGFAAIANAMKAADLTGDRSGGTNSSNRTAADLVFQDSASRNRYFFVSFAGPRRDLALRIGQSLCDEFSAKKGHLGSEVFVDSEALTAGTNFERIYKAAGKHACGVCIIEPEFFNRDACVRELCAFEDRRMPLFLVIVAPLADCLNAAISAGLTSSRTTRALEIAVHKYPDALLTSDVIIPGDSNLDFARKSFESPSSSQHVHVGVACDVSGISPIIGNRFHLRGANYDVSQEEFDKLEPTQQRNFELIVEPGQSPIPINRPSRIGDIPWVRFAGSTSPNAMSLSNIAKAVFDLTADWMIEEAVPRLIARCNEEIPFATMSISSVAQLTIARRRLEALGRRVIFPELAAKIIGTMQILNTMANDALLEKEENNLLDLERVVLQDFADDLGKDVLAWFKSQLSVAGQNVFEASQRLTIDRKQRFDQLYINYSMVRVKVQQARMLAQMRESTKTDLALCQGDLPPYTPNIGSLESEQVEFWVCGTQGSSRAEELLKNIRAASTVYTDLPNTTTIVGVKDERHIAELIANDSTTKRSVSVVLGVCLHTWECNEETLCELVLECAEKGRCLAVFPILGAGSDGYVDKYPLSSVSKLLNLRGVLWLSGSSAKVTHEHDIIDNTDKAMLQVVQLVCATSVQALVRSYSAKLQDLGSRLGSNSSCATSDEIADISEAIEEWRRFTDMKSSILQSFSFELGNNDVQSIIQQIEKFIMVAQAEQKKIQASLSQGKRSLSLLIPTATFSNPLVRIRGARISQLIDRRFKQMEQILVELVDLLGKLTFWRHGPWLESLID